MERIDQRDITHEGRTLTVVIVPDLDTSPTDYDEDPYSSEDITAWGMSQWSFVGVLIMEGDTELDALWAVEYGALDTVTIDMDYIISTHPVPDMLVGLPPVAPKINPNPGANRYTLPGERIAEISLGMEGCLLSAREYEGHLRVEIYRADDTVQIITPATSTMVMVTSEREALRSLVIYAAQGEDRDYREQCEAEEDTSRHIWHDITTLRRYLERIES
jgi:hypothetical protein